MKLVVFVSVIGALGSSVACADVRLPRLVADNMVLQRDTQLAVWGWADPGETVRVSFQGESSRVYTDKAGHWIASLGPHAAGGPYELVVSGRNRIVLHDVLVGDVWLASGQSNMEMPLNAGPEWQGGIQNEKREIAGAEFPKIRLFLADRKIAFAPQADIRSKEGWRPVTPDTVKGFSALAYLFGRELYQRYQVPIGLIDSSWGGTVAEAWVSDTSLVAIPEFQKATESVRHANSSEAAAEWDAYSNRKADWDNKHGTEDRGRQGSDNIWAGVALDTTGWATVAEPQKEKIPALKDFDRTVWFRRTVQLSNNAAGKLLLVHMIYAGKSETFFNGEQIGTTEGWEQKRDYIVPATLVRAGQNILTVRETGRDGYAGLFGEPDQMSVEVDGATLPLAGTWTYQPGPDLSDLPAPSALAKLHSDPNTPTVLFNGMINPLTHFRIKGVIWYQGESNATDSNRSAQYRTLFPALIQDWRKNWRSDFPFLFVQLAGFGHNKPDPAEYPWAELREAQSTTLALPKTGMATAIDIGDEGDIHPKDKQDVAHRLALAAAAVAYGEKLVYSGPRYQSMKIEGNRVRIAFSNVGSGLVLKDKYGYGRGFEIAGANGQFVWANARKEGQDIVVSSDAVKAPVAVRYDWSNTPDGNVFNIEGLPATPFRTDGPKN